MPLTYPGFQRTDITAREGKAGIGAETAGFPVPDRHAGIILASPFHPLPGRCNSSAIAKIVRAGIMENLCQRIILLFICRGFPDSDKRMLPDSFRSISMSPRLSVFTTVSMWNELTLAYSDRKCESTVPSRYISPSQTNGSGCRYSVEASPRTGIPVNRRSTGRVSRRSMASSFCCDSRAVCG